MRGWSKVPFLSCLVLAASFACKGQGRELSQPAPRPAVSTAIAPPEPTAPPARALSSAVVALEKTLQVEKLSVPPRRSHEPQLAFGKGVFGQLTHDALVVYDTTDFRALASEPLESPRALLALADGSLLALGSRHMLRWQRDQKRATPLARPLVLPGVELYADAQQADLIWIFDGGSASATLRGYRLQPEAGASALPEQSVELSSAGRGVFGASREGVWLYCTTGHVERLSPGGLRLPGLTVPNGPLPTWIVPTRRLDQSLWLDESGHVARVLVTPTYKLLSSAQLPGTVADVAVGDEGRLLASVVVTGPGPRFELVLLDAALAERGRVVLPAEAPTGADDWIQVVTENQRVAVAPRSERVAVGGPTRVTIFDAGANKVFSIPSR